MKISFVVHSLPPKKDGANSMWRKGSEQEHLRALRKAAFLAMEGRMLIDSEITLTIRIHAKPSKGDLDNFITGICDGLMAAHPQTPIDHALWQDVPDLVRPQHAICYRDDVLIHRIIAERVAFDGVSDSYEVELEWK